MLLGTINYVKELKKVAKNQIIINGKTQPKAFIDFKKLKTRLLNSIITFVVSWKKGGIILLFFNVCFLFDYFVFLL